jgi:hypothetical protein
MDRVIHSGQFDYDRIDVEEKVVSVSGGTALAKASGIVDATTNGMRRRWGLQFTIRSRDTVTPR